MSKNLVKMTAERSLMVFLPRMMFVGGGVLEDDKFGEDGLSLVPGSDGEGKCDGAVWLKEVIPEPGYPLMVGL